MRRLKLLTIFIACLLPACMPKVDRSDIVTINLDTADENLLLSDFADSICYLELNIPDSVLIGYIDNVIVRDDHIITIDNNRKSPIAIFDTSGNFINLIGHHGEGPGEYRRVRAVDMINDTVYVFDSMLGYALKYDLTGNYIDKDTIPAGDDYMSSYNNNGVSFISAGYSAPMQEWTGVFLKKPGMASEHIYFRRDSLVKQDHINEFAFTNGEIRHLSGDFEYKLLRLDNDSLVCEYVFDLTSAPSANKINNWNGDFQDSQKYFTRASFWNSPRWLMINFCKVGEARLVLFDKSSKSVKITKSIKNDIDGNNDLYFHPTVINGSLIGISQTDDKAPRIMFVHLKE